MASRPVPNKYTISIWNLITLTFKTVSNYTSILFFLDHIKIYQLSGMISGPTFLHTPTFCFQFFIAITKQLRKMSLFFLKKWFIWLKYTEIFFSKKGFTYCYFMFNGVSLSCTCGWRCQRLWNWYYPSSLKEQPVLLDTEISLQPEI